MISQKHSTHSSTLAVRGQGYIGLAQINPTAGDLRGNAQKIMAALAAAEAQNLDLVVFPELALMGYPIRDIIVRHPFIVEENLKWLHAIAKRTGKTRAIVGFVEPRNGKERRHGKPFYNAAAVLGEGKIEGIVRKSLLPNYGEFNDVRTFEPSPIIGLAPAETLGTGLPQYTGSPHLGDICHIHGHTYGISICEDIWNDPQFFTHPLYPNDPIEKLATLQPEVMINLSASPTRSRKEQMKHHLLSHLAQKYQRPWVYVNQVGAIDECSFDGASRLYNGQGNLVARAPSFKEHLLVVNPFLEEGPIYPLAPGLEETLEAPKVFNAFDQTDLGRTYETLLQGIRDYFQKIGFSRAILGLSGGIDSAVVATLLVDALGPHQVVGVSMPSAITPADNEEDAAQLAQNLGILFIRVPIGESLHTVEQGIEGAPKTALNGHWGAPPVDTIAHENLQARLRAVILWRLGNEYHACPIATSDKSEFYLGYTTIYGDMAGSLAPLGDVPKTKVRQLAHWMNTHRPTPLALPLSVIERPSGADLALDPHTGQTVKAEDALMPYEFADEVIWRLEALHQSKAEMLHQPFQWEKNHATPFELKQAWLDKFFQRMTTSVFKWWVSPPMIIVEGNGSISKTDYHHPITAKKIEWNTLSATEIEEALNRAVPPQNTSCV